MIELQLHVYMLSKEEGYETLIFHTTGIGGRAMEDLIRRGFIQCVLDITTTEVADYVVGGVMACDNSHLDVMKIRNLSAL